MIPLRKTLLLGVFAASALAGGAQAAVITFETPSTIAPANGLMSTQAGVTTQTFNGVAVGAQAPGFTPAAGTIPGGGVVAGGGNGGLYAGPNGDTSQFYAVAYNPAPGPVVPASDTWVTPGNASFNYFGLYWGSIDTYNTISFFNGASLVQSFTGAAFMPASGNQTAANTNEYIDFFFTAGDTYNRVVFATQNLNFEFDNFAFGNVQVPEPASMTLLGTGLLGIGLVRRRKASAA